MKSKNKAQRSKKEDKKRTTTQAEGGSMFSASTVIFVLFMIYEMKGNRLRAGGGGQK